MRHVIALALVLYGVLAGLAPAEARRVALVIGNAAYRAVAELPNPRKDARDVAAALRAAAFDEVVERYNLGIQQMRHELAAFEDKATGADWAVVYYAGHGIEVDGRNFLVPIDAELKRSTDVEDETYALDRVLARMAAAGKLQLVILDACRENPFKRRMAGIATRAIGERGLARIEPAQPNVIVAYAARDGQVALDGKPGENSPYARALVKYLAEPGLEIGNLFRKVRDDVLAATGGKQRPFEYGSLTGQQLFFRPGTGAGPKLPAAVSPPPQQSSGVEQAWAAAKDSMSIPVLEAFRLEFGSRSAFYDRLAKDRIDELRRQQLAMLKMEEDRRRAEEKKRAEADLLRPGRTFRDCPECPEMVVVPSGSFIMGSPPSEAGRDKDEGPQRRVTITRPFAVGRFEVTRGEFAAFVRETGHSAGDRCWTLEGGKFQERSGRSFRNPGFQQDDRHPVVCVDWHDATAYAGWLSRKTGKTYRLLTEAEWEYVARAGSTTRYHFGDREQELCTYSNGADLTAKAKYRDWTIAACRDGYVYTAPAGSFQPNAFGLYDVHGNVLEWVQDCWNHSYYNGAPTDGSAWTTGDCGRRVVRGGSSVDLPGALRAAYRGRYATGVRNYFIGFRLARTL